MNTHKTLQKRVYRCTQSPNLAMLKSLGLTVVLASSLFLGANEAGAAGITWTGNDKGATPEGTEMEKITTWDDKDDLKYNDALWNMSTIFPSSGNGELTLEGGTPSTGKEALTIYAVGSNPQGAQNSILNIKLGGTVNADKKSTAALELGYKDQTASLTLASNVKVESGGKLTINGGSSLKVTGGSSSVVEQGGVLALNGGGLYIGSITVQGVYDSAQGKESARLTYRSGSASAPNKIVGDVTLRDGGRLASPSNSNEHSLLEIDGNLDIYANGKTGLEATKANAYTLKTKTLTLNGNASGMVAVYGSLDIGTLVQKTSGSNTGEIKILRGGTVNIAFGQVAKAGPGGEWNIIQSLDQELFQVDAGATLRISGSPSASVDLAQLKNLKDGLFTMTGSRGLIEIVGANYSATEGNVADLWNIMAPNLALKDTQSALQNAYLSTGVSHIVVTGSSPELLPLMVDDLRLVGTGAGGALVVDASGKAVKTNVNVYSVFTLGNANGATSTEGTWLGNITLEEKAYASSNDGSTFNVQNINLNMNGDILVKSDNRVVNKIAIDIDNSTLHFVGESKIDVTDTNATLDINHSTVDVAAIKLGQSIYNATTTFTSSLLLGNSRLTVGTLDADSGTVYVHGKLGANPSTNASALAIENGKVVSADSFEISGKFIASAGSQVSLGSKDSTLLPTLLVDPKTELNGLWGAPNGIFASAYVAKPLHFAAAANVANNNLPTFLHIGSQFSSNDKNTHQFHLAADGLLAVDVNALRDASGKTTKAAITAFGTQAETAVIENGARLLLTHAFDGDSITVLDNFANITNTAGGTELATLTNDQLFFDNRLLRAKSEIKITANTLVVEVGAEKAEEALPGISTGGAVSDIVNAYLSQSGGVSNAFMDNALSLSLHPDSASSTVALEAGLDTARAVDTQGSSTVAVNANANLALDRAMGNAFANVIGLAAGSASTMTFGLWGMPVYAHEQLDNAKIDGTSFRVDSKTNTYGGIMGADLTLGQNQQYRIGASLNVGTGESKAQRMSVKTKNNFDYVGGALYASALYDKFRVAGIVGYTAIDNDIKQDQPGGQLQSKPNSSIWNLGLEASYTFTFTNGVNLIPTLGIEWLHYSQDSYTTTLNNIAVVNVASASANRVNLPIGVKLNKAFALSETASISPEIRAAIIPSFGSTMNTTSSLPGIIGANGTMRGVNTDNVAGEVGLGLSVQLNQNFSLAVGYDVQFSKTRTSHNVNAMLRLSF